MNLLEEKDEFVLKNILKDFIDRKCIFRCNPEVRYAQGIDKGILPGSSPKGYMRSQFYLRNLTHDSDMVTCATMLIINQMFKNGMTDTVFQIAGLETSSIPLISHLQAKMRVANKSVNTFSIRKERKKYGLFQFVDGIPNQSNFVVVDDLINSGSSVHRVLDTCLYECNLDPYPESFFIVNMRPERKYIPFNGALIRVNSIFDKNDFSFEYDPEKYWLPLDCDRSFNHRPDYK